MSNDKTVTETAPKAGSTDEIATKPNFLQKSKTFVSRHKKLAIAAGALVTLTGVAALAGRKSADYDLDVELVPMERVPADETESTDIVA